MSSLSLAERIRSSLNASRREADRIIDEAEAQAQALDARATDVGRTLAQTQLLQLADMRGELDRNGRRIDAAHARMAESMAIASMRLVEAARDADFRPPPWPGGIGRTVEVKLSETREVTLRLAAGGEQRNERR